VDFFYLMEIEKAIKQTKFRNAYQKAAINLIYTSGWLEGMQKSFFKQYGITNQQFNILRILRGQFPNKISGADIKTRMLDQNSDVSRLLDRLIIKKLIIKGQCPNDKRAADVAISESGLELLKKIDRQIEDLDGLLSNLTKEEASQLSLLLDKSRG
jgi:DNA-binding MarR family transcriptional regulator